jgi:hypothetical protein
MTILNNTFTNREIAILVWSIVIIAWLLSQKSLRSSIVDLLKASVAITPPILIMFLYVSVIVFTLYINHFWNSTMIKDTTLWVIGGALVMLFSSMKAMEDERHLRDVVVQNLAFLIIIEYIISQYVFALWIELTLVPVLTLLGMVQIVAATKKDFLSVKKLFDILLALIGLFLIAHALYGILSDVKSFVTPDNLRSFLLPPILSIAFLPFLYGFVLWMKYSNVFVRIKVFNIDKDLARYAKWQVFLTCGLSLECLNGWSKKMGVLHLENREDMRRITQEFKATKTKR